jgi:two-component system response regulator ResD
MPAGTILVVDDEPGIREVVRMYLEQDGFQVVEAGDGRQALALAAECDPQLIILDLMLPGMDGWEVCRRIRSRSNTPIIMLTAKVMEADRVIGLELGADDYVSKPFSPRELSARVRAVLRRAQPADKKRQVLRYEGLTIDRDSRTVTSESREIALTPKEFDLLWFLAKEPGKVFSRETLLQNVWNYEYLGDARTVDSHIRSLRHKLGAAGRRHVRTVWGVGYKFVADQPGIG